MACLLGALLVACAAPAPDQELNTALDAAHEAARDSTRTADAARLLETFLREHPRHRGAPEALLQLAILRQQQGDADAAVSTYERVLSEFPTSEVAPKAQFMIAFVSEEHLADYDAARRAYQAVIDNYPDSDLAAQARQLIAHVGVPPDQWVPGFQESGGRGEGH